MTVSFEENIATAASMRDTEASTKADDAFETCVVSVAEYPLHFDLEMAGL